MLDQAAEAQLADGRAFAGLLVGQSLGGPDQGGAGEGEFGEQFGAFV
ncbi:hypothetical protein GCM10029964_000040 [Kibdelosporangium lantanae]